MARYEYGVSRWAPMRRTQDGRLQLLEVLEAFADRPQHEVRVAARAERAEGAQHRQALLEGCEHLDELVALLGTLVLGHLVAPGGSQLEEEIADVLAGDRRRNLATAARRWAQW